VTFPESVESGTCHRPAPTIRRVRDFTHLPASVAARRRPDERALRRRQTAAICSEGARFAVVGQLPRLCTSLACADEGVSSSRHPLLQLTACSGGSSVAPAQWSLRMRLPPPCAWCLCGAVTDPLPDLRLDSASRRVYNSTGQTAQDAGDSRQVSG
jgi:hypothetical protein